MTSKDLEEVLRIIRNAKESYRMAQLDKSDEENVTQDILHRLELDDTVDYRERARLGKSLTDARKSRRAAKDALEILQPFVLWIDANTSEINALTRVLGDIRKTEERHKNRIYTPRTGAGQKKNM